MPKLIAQRTKRINLKLAFLWTDSIYIVGHL